MPTFSPPKLHALTALRFFAAAAIVLHHSCSLFPWDQSLTDTFHLSQAVSFFFVLSGFILTYVYPSLDAWPARARFLRARFARVWPAHLAAFALLFLLFGTPARFGTLYGSFPLALLNLSMLQAWVPVRYAYSSFNFVSWTISTEFAFYLLFPLLIHNFHKTWLLKLLLSLALFAASIALVILCHIPPEDPAHSWNISILGIVYVNPLARLFEFTLGMTTALLFQRTLHKPKTRLLPATGLELAAIAGVALNMYLAPAIARLLVGNSPQLAPLRDALVLGQLSCLSFAALIYIMAHNNGPLARLLSSPPLILLGEISYSVYLLHLLLLTFINNHFPFTTSPHPLLLYTLFWLLLLLSSYLVWLTIERPLRRWITQSKRPTPTPHPPREPAA